MRVSTKSTGRIAAVGMFGLLLFGLGAAGAASSSLSRSYGADEAFTTGSLVSLDERRSDFVELADSRNGSRLVGVVVPPDDSLLAVDSAGGKVQVATSGIVNALVSTLGGPIGVGDEVGVSPFSGIGIRATPGSRIIGLAQGEFKEGSKGAIRQSAKDKQGKMNQITVGYVPVSIAIATDGTLSKEAKLNGLQRLVQGMTGRTIPTVRLVIILAIAITALLVLVTLVYAAIYGSIISIGRNPLAKYAVFRTLSVVIGLALLTAGVAGLSIFFLLR